MTTEETLLRMKKIIYILVTYADYGYACTEAVFSSKKELDIFTSKFPESSYDVQEIELDYWTRKKEEIKDCVPYHIVFIDNKIASIRVLKAKFNARKNNEVYFSCWRPIHLEITLFSKNTKEAKEKAVELKNKWITDPKNKDNIKNGWLDKSKELTRVCF